MYVIESRGEGSLGHRFYIGRHSTLGYQTSTDPTAIPPFSTPADARCWMEELPDGIRRLSLEVVKIG